MAGDPETLAKIKGYFAFFQHPQTLAGPGSVPSSGLLRALDPLLPIIFMACVRYGGASEWESVFATLVHPSSPMHREAAMAGITASQDPQLIERTVAFVFGRFGSPDVKTEVGTNADLAIASASASASLPLDPWHPSLPASQTLTDSDIVSFCGFMAGQPTEIRPRLVEALRVHWPALRTQLEGGPAFTRIIDGAISSLASERDVQQATQWVQDHPEARTAASRALERVKESTRCLVGLRAALPQWLRERGL